MTARQGYVLLLGIVLRPLLLVVGIMTGAVLLQMVGWLLKFMAPIMMGSLDITDPPGFMGFIAVLAIFSYVIVSSALRCFALSHELADEILEWIGGNARTLGDGNAGQAAQAGAMYMTSTALTSAQGAGKAFSGIRTAMAKRQEPTKKTEQSNHSTGA